MVNDTFSLFRYTFVNLSSLLNGFIEFYTNVIILERIYCIIQYIFLVDSGLMFQDFESTRPWLEYGLRKSEIVAPCGRQTLRITNSWHTIFHLTRSYHYNGTRLSSYSLQTHQWVSNWFMCRSRSTADFSNYIAYLCKKSILPFRIIVPYFPWLVEYIIKFKF